MRLRLFRLTLALGVMLTACGASPATSTPEPTLTPTATATNPPTAQIATAPPAPTSTAQPSAPLQSPIQSTQPAQAEPSQPSVQPAQASPLAQPAPVEPTAETTAAAQVTVTPRAFLPSVKRSEFKRILFINGDHIPENGYPHSRVRDDGAKPESFTRLRTEVLEREIAPTVDEFILTAGNAITPGLLSPYAAVVLGSNGRPLNADEVTALTNYFTDGGSILLYADFQYGPDNWTSDNGFLKQFGVEVFPDNFQPTTQITDIVSSHPIMQGVTSFATEGSSQFLISAATQADNIVLSKCSPLERSGCAVQAPEQAKIQPGDVVACTWVRENANGGKIAGTCDRNTFHNGPGPGTDIDQFDNRVYARNLFQWLLK